MLLERLIALLDELPLGHPKLKRLLLLIGILWPAWIWLQDAQPDPMTGEWNIAIAQFSSEVSYIDRDEARLISNQFYRKLTEEVRSLPTPILIEVADPDSIGRISGSTEESRLTFVEDLASTIKADIVIYGALRENAGAVYFEPEIYLSTKNSYELHELSGHSLFGSPIPIIGAVEHNIPSQIELNRDFSNRATLFALLSKGLSDYLYLNFESAHQYFVLANDEEFWGTNRGREVAHLLAGNAAMKMGNYALAESHLTDSLKIDEEYSRAMISMGGLRYLQAIQNATSAEFTVDERLLQEAIEWHRKAQTALNQPASADISAKVNFGLGQVFLVQYLSGEETLYEAVSSFDAVVTEFQATGNPRISHMAAESYDRMAVLFRESGSYDTAIMYLEYAIQLSRVSSRTALFWKTLGDLHVQVNDYSNAELAYANSISSYRAAIAASSVKQQSLFYAAIAENYLRLHDQALAIDSYLKAISLLPSHSPLIETYTQRIQDIK